MTRAASLNTTVRYRIKGNSIFNSSAHIFCKRSTFTTATKHSNFRFIFEELKKRPLQYFTIPSVAAFVGLTTNWMGVNMLFYPIDYVGTELYRSSPYTPYGMFGWQGVVPCKTEKMAARLVDIVTERLLTIEEAFGRLDPSNLAQLLLPIIEDELLQELPQYYGELMIKLIRPVLPYILSKVMANLQKEIDDILDLKSVVLDAFVRDKQVLVELFQKVSIQRGKSFEFGVCISLIVWSLVHCMLSSIGRSCRT